LDHVRGTIEAEPEAKMPKWFSLKWWVFLLCAVCFLLSAAGAISNIVCRLLPETQAFWPAVAVAVVWVMLAVAAKIGLRSVRSPIREKLHWGIFAIGLCGAIVWLVGLVTGYAMEINLDNIGTSGVLSHSKVAPFVGQLMAEFAVGFACLTGLLSLVQHPRPTIPNPARRVLSERLSELNGEAGKILSELANPQGVGIIRARIADGETDAAVLAELQRRRGENQRLLNEFTN
jgi:hypothetical protein